jgi:molybdopterin-guanine dinucleotide biosynthesis protein A
MASTMDRQPLPTRYPRDDITGVVLAGGRARRMGGEDKGLIRVDGEAMVVHALRGLQPQVGPLLINANRNQERYAELGRCDVVADVDGDFAGPLAGMVSAMQRATTRYILTVPCDSPLLALNLGVLDCALRQSIVDYLGSGGRKIDAWYATRRMALGNLADHPSMFLNINTPEDRDLLEKQLAGQRRC